MINHTVRWARTAVTLVVLLCLAGDLDVAYAEILILEGSTTFDAVILSTQRPAIEAMSGHTLRVLPNRSNLGLAAVLEGRADFAMISATLDREVALLRESRPDLPYRRL